MFKATRAPAPAPAHMRRRCGRTAVILLALACSSWAGGSIGWQAAGGSSQCFLSSLTLQAGSGTLRLTPPFAPSVRLYSAILDYAAPPPQVEARAPDGCHSRRVDGGAPIGPGDQGEVRVEVSIASAVVSTYIVTVVRRAGLEDRLWSLAVNSTWWSPDFKTDVLTYVAVVPPISAQSLTLSYSKMDSGQSVEVVIGDYTIFTAAADRARTFRAAANIATTTTSSVSTALQTTQTSSGAVVRGSIIGAIPAAASPFVTTTATATVNTASSLGDNASLVRDGAIPPTAAVATESTRTGIATNASIWTSPTSTSAPGAGLPQVSAVFTITASTKAATTASTTTVAATTSSVVLSGASSHGDLLAAEPQPPLEPTASQLSSPQTARALDAIGSQILPLAQSTSLALGSFLPNGSLVLAVAGSPVLVSLPATVILRVWPAAVSADAGQPPSYRWPAPARIYTVALSKAPLESIAPQGLPRPLRMAWGAVNLELHKHPIVVPPEHQVPLAVFGTLSVATVLCLFPLCAACPCLGGAGD